MIMTYKQFYTASKQDTDILDVYYPYLRDAMDCNNISDPLTMGFCIGSIIYDTDNFLKKRFDMPIINHRYGLVRRLKYLELKHLNRKMKVRYEFNPALMEKPFNICHSAVLVFKYRKMDKILKSGNYLYAMSSYIYSKSAEKYMKILIKSLKAFGCEKKIIHSLINKFNDYNISMKSICKVKKQGVQNFLYIRNKTYGDYMGIIEEFKDLANRYID